MATKKMSKARKALFALHPWLTPEQAKKLHKDLSESYASLIDLYGPSEIKQLCGIEPLKFTDDVDYNGNLILAEYLQRSSPEERQRQQQKLANRAEARSRHFEDFRETFHVDLKDFWGGNLLGFDILKFDEQIAKSAANESVSDAIRRQCGAKGV